MKTEVSRFQNRQGDELPAWVSNKVERQKETREAKAATHAKNGKPGSLVARMRQRLQRGGWRSPYRLRKQVVEPVFGQIKQRKTPQTGNTSGPGPIQAEALSVEHKQVLPAMLSVA